MKRIFVDTSVWCAYFVKKDQFHSKALSLINYYKDDLVTTDYIIDETITLIRKRASFKTASIVANSLISSQLARIIEITRFDLFQALKIFNKYSDQDFSFTDCTSFAVIQRLNIKNVFSFDKHFKIFIPAITLL